MRTTLSDFRIGNNLNTPQNRVLRTYQLVDNVSWRKGDHRIRFGGEWEHHYGVGHWAYLEPADNGSSRGPLRLAALASPFVYNALPATVEESGRLAPKLRRYFQAADLRQASPASAIQDNRRPSGSRRASRNNRYRLLISDPWRVKQRFTLSYGVSYGYEDNLLNHDLRRGRPTCLRCSAATCVRLSTTRDDSDPTVGFAWDVGGIRRQ